MAKHKTPNSDAVHSLTKHQIVTKTPSGHGQNIVQVPRMPTIRERGGPLSTPSVITELREREKTSAGERS